MKTQTMTTVIFSVRARALFKTPAPDLLSPSPAWSLEFSVKKKDFTLGLKSVGAPMIVILLS